VLGTPNDCGEHRARRIIAGETRLHHARPIVHDQALDILLGHCDDGSQMQTAAGRKRLLCAAQATSSTANRLAARCGRLCTAVFWRACRLATTAWEPVKKKDPPKMAISSHDNLARLAPARWPCLYGRPRAAAVERHHAQACSVEPSAQCVCQFYGRRDEAAHVFVAPGVVVSALRRNLYNS